MTDKEKIREEVERMHNLLPIMDGDNISVNYADRICTTLEMYIDSLQEEPVSIWHEASKKYPLTGKEIIILRDDKIYYGKYIGGFHRYVRAEIQLTDDTAQAYAIIDYITKKDKWIYVEDLLNLSNVERTTKNWKEPVKRTTADIEASMQEVEDKSRAFTEAHKGENADTILAQMRGEEPVSEDLGEYIDKLSKQFPEVSFAKLSRVAVRVAKWQKQKDDREIKMVRELLADFDKHCDEYHEAGFKHGQEALLKDAVEAVCDVTIHAKGDEVQYSVLYPVGKRHFHKGDKVKVIIIKEN